MFNVVLAAWVTHSIECFYLDFFLGVRVQMTQIISGNEYVALLAIIQEQQFVSIRMQFIMNFAYFANHENNYSLQLVYTSYILSYIVILK